MVRGAASPSRVFNFVREDNTIPDLTNAESVVFNIFRPDTSAQTNQGAGANCVILSPGTAGQARYDWATTDLPVSGTYRCIIQITDSNGKPEKGIVYIEVESDTN